MSRSVCAWTEREEVFEGYVRDALGPEDRDAFEAHYFECAACFERVQTYQAMRDELTALPAELAAAEPARGWPWRWVFVPVAAGIVLLVAAALWFKAPAPAAPESTVAVAPAPPAQPTPPTTTPTAGGEAQSRPAPPAPPPVVALSILARVDPPLYVPVALRGPRDEAAKAFDAAMRLYAGGDYAGAIPGLRTAASLRPEAPQIAFFLAACHLLTGQVDEAASGLERTTALGDSPYLEEAYFYLAKARLRQGRVSAARDELRRTIDRRGRLEQEARRLLTQIDALAAGKDRPPAN